VAALLGILALRQYPADWRFWFCCRWLAVALGALIAAPAAGLYWSLRFGQTVKAWLAAWLSILLSGLPFVVLACRTVFGLSNGGYDRSRPAFSMACCAGALLWGILAAWVFWRITRRSLIRREFPLI
jgi:hypothetical protein